ncbi:MAG: hypothetical protein M0P01_14175 [Treponema sp.]|nr:hypothetical protein [Treponema sp.]
MKLLETSDNSSKLIEKAKNACIGTGQKSVDHFPDVGKVIEVGKGNDLFLYRCLPCDFFAHHKTCITSCKYFDTTQKTTHETTQIISKNYPENVGHTLKESSHD